MNPLNHCLLIFDWKMEKEDKLYEKDILEQYAPIIKENDSKTHNIVYEFIRNLKPGVELFRTPVPVFLISPISLLERQMMYSNPNFLLIR